jgi:hypothetical protein
MMMMMMMMMMMLMMCYEAFNHRFQMNKSHRSDSACGLRVAYGRVQPCGSLF